jgi:hypothetical protein
MEQLRQLGQLGRGGGQHQRARGVRARPLHQPASGAASSRTPSPAWSASTSAWLALDKWSALKAPLRDAEGYVWQCLDPRGSWWRIRRDQGHRDRAAAAHSGESGSLNSSELRERGRRVSIRPKRRRRARRIWRLVPKFAKILGAYKILSILLIFSLYTSENTYALPW